MKNAVIIYTMWPRANYTKTRIAEDTSAEFARAMAHASMDDLISNIKSDFFDLLVGVNTKWELSQFGKNYGLDGILTQEATQSERFKSVFTRLLNDKEYENAILIPSDLPFLRESEMISAFARMHKNKYVFGPENNGGIYTIGVRGPFNKNIFESVDWSTAHTFSDLVSAAGESDTYKLQKKSDLNTFHDVLRSKDQIRSNCPKLYDLLRSNGYFTGEQMYVDFDNLNINLPVVMSVVERDDSAKPDILIQTRYKPTSDPKYTGKLEIPSGLIEKYEPASLAAVREIEEETGIFVEILESFDNKNVFSSSSDEVLEFTPFCCSQQLMGGRSYLAIGYVSRAASGELRENKFETRNPRWVPFEEVKKLVFDMPDKVFPINIPLLRKYISYKES